MRGLLMDCTRTAWNRDGQSAMDPTVHYQVPPSGSASAPRANQSFHGMAAYPYQSPFQADAPFHADSNLQHNHNPLHHSQSQTFYPNPNPDTSLACPPSPESHLPSVQVTHPTPTKPIKYRRQSVSALSISTAGSFDPSPLAQSQLLPSPASGTDALEVMIEPSPRSRPRSPEDESEAERERDRQAEKQARVREKGRERQRRKRERDKKAKEANTSVPTLPLTTGGPLPVPPSKSTTPHMLSISVPSSASSIASSLPQSASYFSISPGQNTFGFTGSTSASGASTPGTLFSPAATTPSYSPDTTLNTAFFGIGLEGIAIPTGPLEAPEKTKRGSARGKGRAPSTGVTSASMSRKVSPVVEMIPLSEIKSTNPAKRRKSEPRTDEITGLGMMGTDVLQTLTEERPRPRRTASDGAVIKSNHEREWARSPTPPPVPTLPSEYRRKTEPSTCPDSDTISPSAQAETFASRAIYLLNKDDAETGWLREQIGCDAQDLQGMKAALAGLYDRWLLEQGMKDMTLEAREDNGSTAPASHRSMPASPTTSSTSFFTPFTSRQRPPTATVAVQESPLASTHTHTRQRSLSSASMLARGLHINPQTLMTATATTQQWAQPATPTSSTQQFATEPRSDGTASPSLQTPSTGQGSFPLPEQAPYQGHWRSATDPSGQRTYTTMNTQSQTPIQNMTQVDWSQVPNTCPPGGVILDSPLSMAAQIKHGGMPPPPQVPLSNSAVPGDASTVDGQGITETSQQQGQLQSQASIHMQAQPIAQSAHQRHFSTPVTSRTGSVRAVVPIPYTPPTPVPMRGQNHTLSNGSSTIPVWYNSAFLPAPGQMELGSPGPAQHNAGGVFALGQMYNPSTASTTDFPTS
ncbi:hypothetical protein IAT40_005360 [Kwoniella sp. CBS 6097]